MPNRTARSSAVSLSPLEDDQVDTLAFVAGELATNARAPAWASAVLGLELLLTSRRKHVIVALAVALYKAAGVRACRGCACTEDHACDEGCFWAEEDLCSECDSTTRRAERRRRRERKA